MGTLIDANRGMPITANKKYVDDLIYKDLAYKVVGCFYEVYNQLGSGFKELIYCKALAIEFDIQKIIYEKEKRISIKYKGKNTVIIHQIL